MSLTNKLYALVPLGDYKKVIEVHGHKISLRLLNAGHTRDIFVAASGDDMLAKEKIVAIKTLARAIWSIDGEELQYNSQDPNDAITEAKFYAQNENIISQWPWKLVSDIYKHYVDFEDECENQISSASQNFLGQTTG